MQLGKKRHAIFSYPSTYGSVAASSQEKYLREGLLTPMFLQQFCEIYLLILKRGSNDILHLLLRRRIIFFNLINDK